MNRNPLALALAALVLVGTTACNRNNDSDGGTTNTPSADTATADAVTGTQPAGPAVPPGTDAAAAPTQGEALALLNAVNDHEVKSAELAKSKNVTGPVLEYANQMAAEHGKNMSDTATLLQTAGATAAAAAPTAAAGAGTDSARVNAQRAKAEAKRAQLQGLEGEAFARAYMEAMVADHTEALGMLDSLLIPSATDDAVRTHLTTTRQHVQHHLERAQQIHAQLGGSGAAGAGGGTGQG